MPHVIILEVYDENGVVIGQIEIPGPHDDGEVQSANPEYKVTIDIGKIIKDRGIVTKKPER